MKATEKSVLLFDMKKKILLFVAIFISGYSFSQQSPTIGIRAGVSSSGIRGDAAQSLNQVLQFTNGIIGTSDRVGFFAGGYASIPFSDNFSIEPGIYYTQKGYQMKGQFDLKGAGFLGANARADLITQYIDVPLYLKGTWEGLQIFAGPQISYLASANLKTTAGLLGVNLLNSNTDVVNMMNRWDAAVTGGIGYQFSNGLGITASYDYGLMKVDSDKRANAFNRGFKVGLGVQF